MNSQTNHLSGDQDAPAVEVSKTAGMLLREAREARGLHVAALAVAMKVPVKKLEALESDALDQASDAVFVRALASSMCRTLKIDPGPILEKLPRSKIPRLEPDERAINAAFSDSSVGRSTNLIEFFSKPVVLGVIGLILGALALFLVPESVTFFDRQERVQTPLPSDPVSVSPSGPSKMASASEPVQLDVSKDSVSKETVVGQSTISSQPSPVEKSNATIPGAEVSGSTSGIVAFRASGTSWIEVTDSQGVVQLRKTLEAGERAAASGKLPLSVVIGRADVTVVEVRGRTFALDAVSKDNVARFEVK